jgi:hypothetical protein
VGTDARFIGRSSPARFAGEIVTHKLAVISQKSSGRHSTFAGATYSIGSSLDGGAQGSISVAVDIPHVAHGIGLKGCP